MKQLCDACRETATRVKQLGNACRETTTRMNGLLCVSCEIATRVNGLVYGRRETATHGKQLCGVSRETAACLNQQVFRSPRTVTEIRRSLPSDREMACRVNESHSFHLSVDGSSLWAIYARVPLRLAAKQAQGGCANQPIRTSPLEELRNLTNRQPKVNNATAFF